MSNGILRSFLPDFRIIILDLRLDARELFDPVDKCSYFRSLCTRVSLMLTISHHRSIYQVLHPIKIGFEIILLYNVKNNTLIL
jgi:hypothetical protein